MQLRVGSVAVTNGSAVIAGVYDAVLSGVTGSAFTVGETMLWEVSGVGAVSRHDTIVSRLYFTRISGPVPAAGNAIRNPGLTKGATIASFASDSTPDFATQLSGSGGPKLFTVQGSGIIYSILSAGADSVTLAGTYGGPTSVEAAYVIVRDFEAYFGWALPAPSDVDLGSILGRAIASIGTTLNGVAATAPTFGANWENLTGSVARYWKDADRVVHLAGACKNTVDSAPSTIFTLPAGYRPLYTQRVPIIVGSVSLGVLEISTAGVVQIVTGVVSAAVYIDGVTFRAEA